MGWQDDTYYSENDLRDAWDHQQQLEEEQQMNDVSHETTPNYMPRFFATMSQEIGDLAKALSKAQANMGHAHKSGVNPHFKSSYADLADCLNAVREPLTKNGLAVTQLPGEDSGKVTVTTVLMHESGQYISTVAKVAPQQNTPHGVGSAITYLRRYSLAAITGLAQADDDGNAGSGKKPENAKVDTTKAEQKLEKAAKDGSSALKKAWEGITKAERQIIGNNKTDWFEGLKSIAADVDAQNQAEA